MKGDKTLHQIVDFSRINLVLHKMYQGMTNMMILQIALG